jgi:hypothetical protein
MEEVAKDTRIKLTNLQERFWLFKALRAAETAIADSQNPIACNLLSASMPYETNNA